MLGSLSFQSLQAYRRLYHEQYLAPEELARRQDQRLQRIIRHAYEHTPHYRQAFDEAGIRPENIRSKEDLVRVPLLKREHLRNISSQIAQSAAGGPLQWAFA